MHDSTAALRDSCVKGREMALEAFQILQKGQHIWLSEKFMNLFIWTLHFTCLRKKQ